MNKAISKALQGVSSLCSPKTQILVIFVLLLFQSQKANAIIDTIPTGSFIINMSATNPNTINNGLKPYGLIYELVRNHFVPIKWVINQTKGKDSVDFVHNGISYRSGAFIVPASFRNAAVNAQIVIWQGEGVVGTTTVSPFAVNVIKEINTVPDWTLDDENGDIAEDILNDAGINTNDYPGAYNWKLPGSLDCCDDFFVMPHASPEWFDGSTLAHGWLLDWNLTCKGAIWTGCHAAGNLENMVNPNNRSIQTNFLTKKVSGLQGTSGDYANSNSLLLTGDHDDGSLPYIHQYPADPIAQYLGITDGAHTNGSEQIYIPNQSVTGGWNDDVKLIVYDPTHQDVVGALRPDLTNAAGVIAYGRGFGDSTRGYVMYEGGHDVGGNAGEEVAAARAFFNFSLFATSEKVPVLDTNNIPASVIGGETTSSFSASMTASVHTGPYTYQWSSSCGGSFTNATGSFTNAVNAITATATTFTAPAAVAPFNCPITCVITTNCGRQTAISKITVILPPPVPDTIYTIPSCNTCSTPPQCATADDLPSEPGSITYTSCGLSISGMGTQVLDTVNGCIVFTGNGMQGTTDTITSCVVACKNGKCDSTYIVILPPPVPDTIYTRPLCNTCSTPPQCATADDLPSGAGDISYTSCGLSPSGMGSQVLDTVNGCIVFTGNGTQSRTDTLNSCVVACKNGKCDTTYIVILPPPIPDTIFTTPTCNTCSTEPLCATADDLPGGPGVITHSSCGLMPSNKGAQAMDTAGCVIFTGNGTQGSFDTLNSCVIACQDGICDTTYIVILPPHIVPHPDVNITFVNVTVTGDVSLNDENWPIGTTYGSPTAIPGNPDGSMPIINSNGTYSFISPLPGVFQYLVPVCEPGIVVPNCPKSLLTITVLDTTVNTNPPVANIDISATERNVPVTLLTLANDQVGEPGRQLVPSSVFILDSPSNGIISVDTVTGNTTYTPNLNFHGIDTLQYRVCDNNTPPLCATSYQLIEILSENAPNTTVAADDYNVTNVNIPVSGNVRLNDKDPEGDLQYVTSQTTNSSGKGTLVLDSTGAYTFTPDSGYVGPVSFPYTTCDTGEPQACAQAVLYILVNGNTFVALPVQVVGFRGKAFEGENMLFWSTQLEQNSALFEIKHGKKSNEMKLLNSVPTKAPNGNSSGLLHYEYSHKNPTIGTHFYQLIGVDLDGKRNASRIVHLLVKDKSSLAIYPNPVTDKLQLSFSDFEELELSLRLSNLNGVSLYEEQFTSKGAFMTKEISMSEWPSGLYILKLWDENGFELIYKISKL